MSDQKPLGKRAGRAISTGINLFLAIFVFPPILYLLYVMGIGGPWIAGVVIIIFAVAAVKPRSAPFMEVPIVSKSMVVGALFALVFILFDMNDQAEKEQELELANLKIFSPEAYVDKLKILGRDDEWFAALKDVHPEEYAAEKARRDEVARRQQAQRFEQGRQDRINQLYKTASDTGQYGIDLKAQDFAGTWNLSVNEARLHCEHGPMANGKPRPLVLLDAGGQSYGINGVAQTNGYTDAHTLLAGDAGVPPYDDKMLDPLLKAGLAMCKATLAKTCGDRIEAITYAQIFVEKRLKSPSSADFSLIDTRAGMSECGTWNVVSYVDAQNSFGVEIRTPFSASVTRQSKSKWVLNVLEMN